MVDNQITIYERMSKRELEKECKRLEEMQHKYAKAGLVVLAHSYTGKLVEATLELSKRP